MAFMTPGADYLVMYSVTDDRGETFNIPEDVCGVLPESLLHVQAASSEEIQEHFGDYLGDDGRIGKLPVVSVERVEGWYGNLSANGYLDQTDYMGPYASAEEAIREVCDFYEVDENGDDVA